MINFNISHSQVTASHPQVINFNTFSCKVTRKSLILMHFNVNSLASHSQVIRKSLARCVFIKINDHVLKFIKISKMTF